MSLLQAHQVSVAYGGIKAVRGVSIDIADTERVVCLIGANGAGKSSLLKALTGLIRPIAGSVRFRGVAVEHLPPHEVIRLGVTLVPEGRGIFARLTVAENLAMGAYTRRDRFAVRADVERMYGLFQRLGERRKQLAGTLSGGEQQMLAMARALMCRPRLLLLDEPSMGLAPIMVGRIYDTIRGIAGDGTAVLLVEQNARLALEVSERGYVMESGEVTLTGDAASLAANPEVRRAYLGE